MEKNNSVKIIAVVALVVAVIGLSVAYASFASNLTVTGTATVSSTWDIEWTTPSGAKTGYATVGSLALSSGNQAITGTIGDLIAPGDTITWTWNVENKGNINASLTGVTLASLSCAPGTGSSATSSEATSFCSNLEIEYTYGGTKITSGTTGLTTALNTGDSKAVTMKITYKESTTSTISGPIAVSLTATPTFSYSQAS